MKRILFKIVLWLLPHVLSFLLDFIERVLRVCKTLDDALENPAEKRTRALMTLQGAYPILNDAAARFLLEAGLILLRLGVSDGAINTMTTLIAESEPEDLTDEEWRYHVLAEFWKLNDHIPEKAGRLIFELALAKINART